MPSGIFKTNVFGQDQTDLPENVSAFRRFEWACRRLLEDEYPPHSHDFLTNEQVDHDDETSDCPDIVIQLQGTDECECVADAKLRKELRRAHVEKIAGYRDRRNAKRAIVFVPEDCHVQSGAEEAEQSLGVEIIKVGGVHRNDPG